MTPGGYLAVTALLVVTFLVWAIAYTYLPI